MNTEGFSLLDYIKLHRDSDCCWDCSDTVFDAVVTVDCSVDQEHLKIDIGADEEFPNMDRFFNAFVSRVRIIEVRNGVPIIDINGWLDHNQDKVIDWVKENWTIDPNDDWDDIKYQMIQEINNGIAGYKGNIAYGLYADLFESMHMAPAESSDIAVPKDVLSLWEQTVCEIRSEIKAQETPALVYAKELCDKLEHSMCASAGGPYELRYKLMED